MPNAMVQPRDGSLQLLLSGNLYRVHWDFNLRRVLGSTRHAEPKRETVKQRFMTDLVTSVMQAAATEVLQGEADQIDQDVQRLLAEIERAAVEECRGGLGRRFLELLERRGEIARKALFIFDEPERTPPADLPCSANLAPARRRANP